MIQPEKTHSESTVSWTTPLWLPVLVAAIFYVCFFSHLSALGLVGPDEPRYAAVAREMAQSGDWVTPRLYNQPWFEKPALYYWAAALAFRAFGVDELSARLPSALAASIATLALAWAALRFYGRTTAWAVLLALPTSLAMFGFARAAGPDMLFAAALTLAMIPAIRLIREEAPPGRAAWWSSIAFGFFIGVATLAKGPAAIVLAAGNAALWALATKQWRSAFRLAQPLAIVAFCGTALPWYMLCAVRNPDFVHTFILAHNFARFFTPVYGHKQPFWFFGPVLVLGLIPWTVLSTGVAHAALRLWYEKRWMEAPGLFFACWAIFPVLFFTVSRSKLPGYVLPSIPPLVLLFARSTMRLIVHKDFFSHWLVTGIGATFLMFAASVPYWLKRLPAASGLRDWHAVFPWMAAAVLGGLAIAALARLRQPSLALLIAVMLMAGLVELTNRRALPRLDPYFSARSAAHAAQFEPGATQTVFFYHMHHTWNYGLNFYFSRELPEWTPQSPRPSLLYTNREGLGKLKRQGIRYILVDQTSPEALLVAIPAAPRNAEQRPAL